MTDCYAAEHCRGADPPASAAYSTPLCEADLTAAEAGITALVHDYRGLEQLIPRPLGQRSDGQPGRGGEAPIPLRLDVEALQREIWWLATAWAEVLADRHRLAPAPSPVRDGFAVQWAVGILRPRVENLARIGVVQMVSYPRSDEDTTRFRTVTLSYVPGAQGVLDLSKAHQRARSMLGLTEPTYELPGKCRNRGCGRPALRVKDGSDTVWCEWCGAVMTRDDYDRYGNLFLREAVAA